MSDIYSEINKMLERNREIDRGFLFLLERPGEVVLKGNFSNIDALNFIKALVQERPEIKDEAMRAIKNIKQPTQGKE